ncbi:MAG: DUF3416 domain-containing protein, partial [Hamadaea sp.]|nr:DUF3416 domain-containing protein [Hamadaea sp.]
MSFDRIVVEDVAPVVAGGRHPAKAVVGEHLPIRATVWRDGHPPVTAVVHWHGPHGKGQVVPMTADAADPDTWHATVVASAAGRWTFRVEAWTDAWLAWREAVAAKAAAGQDAAALANDLETGARLLDRAAAAVPHAASAAATLRDASLPLPDRLAAADA